MVWPYDIRSWSSFWAPRGGDSSGVQFDLIDDPEGKGRYGLRTCELLKHSRQGARFQTLTPPAELLYLAVKRALKGDELTLHSMLNDRQSFLSEARRLEPIIMAPRRQAWAKAALSGRILRSRRSRLQLLSPRNLRRYLRRVIVPIGFVLALPAESAIARSLVEALSPPLVAVRVQTGSGLSYLGQIWLSRRRPFLVLVEGTMPRTCKADLDWSSKLPEDPHAALQSALTRHALRSLSRASWLS